MSELSRMEKHQRRNKKPRKAAKSLFAQLKAMLREGFSGSKPAQEAGRSPDKKISRRMESTAPSRTAAKAAARREGLPPRGSSADRLMNQQQDAMQSIPSRTSTYMSNRVRMSKWFVNSLILIFVLLMAGLLVWGLMGAPPLRTMFG